MRFILFFVVLSFSLQARDSDAPFLDPAENNPQESFRRVGRMMSRLTREKFEEKENLEVFQDHLTDRLTRTLLSLERKLEENSTSINSGGGSSSKQRQDQRKSQGPRKQLNQDNATSKQSSSGQKKEQKGTDLRGQSSQSGGQKFQGEKNPAGFDKDRWGLLPPKVREALKLNLGRDVPQEIENDMKEFLKRIQELE